MPEDDPTGKSLEARALALLARREYTRAELGRRLGRVSPTRPPRQDDPVALADAFAPPPGLPASDDPDADPVGEDDPDHRRAAHAARSAAIEAVLDGLEAQGLLSDQRAAEAIVHARAGQRGLMRIKQELAQKGVSEALAGAALEGLRDAQVPAAREVWRKRFGQLPQDAAERARQTRFLAGRGFSFEVIRIVLGHDDN